MRFSVQLLAIAATVLSFNATPRQAASALFGSAWKACANIFRCGPESAFSSAAPCFVNVRILVRLLSGERVEAT